MPGTLSANGRAYTVGAVVEKIAAESREGFASIHVRDDDGGYSIIVIPRVLGRALSIGDRVTFAVGAMRPDMVADMVAEPCMHASEGLTCYLPLGHVGLHVPVKSDR